MTKLKTTGGRSAWAGTRTVRGWVAVKVPSANLAPAQLTIPSLTLPGRGEGAPRREIAPERPTGLGVRG